jgi:hypothetical protein
MMVRLHVCPDDRNRMRTGGAHSSVACRMADFASVLIVPVVIWFGLTDDC